MAFVWKTPEVTINEITYSIVFLPGEQVRLRITGSGDIPDINSYRPWTDFPYSLDDIWIGEGITSIGKCAFYRNPLLKQVWILNTLTSIGENAFGQCPNLEIIVYEGRESQLQNVDVQAGAIPDWFNLGGKKNGL